jgi:serine/threonine-protein kinase Chk2
MLTVDVEARITIDQCLEHPWTTQADLNPNDSTDGLTGAIAGLDFSKRKMHRERTLLSSINDIRVARVIEGKSGEEAVKVYEKNKNTNMKKKAPGKEVTPAANRDPVEFVQMGGKGDETLFDNTADGSVYPDQTDAVAVNKNGQ